MENLETQEAPKKYDPNTVGIRYRPEVEHTGTRYQHYQEANQKMPANEVEELIKSDQDHLTEFIMDGGQVGVPGERAEQIVFQLLTGAFKENDRQVHTLLIDRLLDALPNPVAMKILESGSTVLPSFLLDRIELFILENYSKNNVLVKDLAKKARQALVGGIRKQ